jgi:hypothetical protein
VDARDLVSFVGAAVFLLSAALTATLLPAQRAARIDRNRTAVTARQGAAAALDNKAR